ncbi:G-type lectin S-receptor-like serine/threonine-protein kinase RKS1 isoform X2 [Pyrus x bretschneideri]|uniref:G-type lectin S-receptor-like serine/threonine-protein kinase RKS1 isoform X2 n=1 Tax=Pyrus x bretschneideri TaxID=225117 RepID=UPI002030CE65|nr:G-type lectin S-receptor-like serine/threonine-protein kinase RKS1 isoform X2 [Pyrus x bretschneideri]
MNSTIFLFVIIRLLIFLVILPSSISVTLDAITPNQPLRDGDFLLSAKKIFKLGFFSPGNSHNRYIGVWYNNIPIQTIVWIANRDNPIIPIAGTGTGLLAIHGDRGGLVIYGKDQNTALWSANVRVSSPNNSVIAKLRDTGNLVLLEYNGSSQRVLWQGFDYPTDTLLPWMKIGQNRRSGLNWSLTSWKSQDDPGSGNFSYEIDPTGFPQLMVYKGRDKWFRGGTWTGKRFSGVPEYTTNSVRNFVNNKDEMYMEITVPNDSVFTRGVLDESGIVKRFIWGAHENKWSEGSSNPSEWCDSYGRCGPNGNCDPYSNYNFSCLCLPGFKPKFPQDWYMRVGSGGCHRKSGASTCQKGDGFVRVARVKVPDSSWARVNMSLSLKGCEQECRKNCSCTAYANADERDGGKGCVTWYGDLMDTRTFSNVGQDLYVRVDAVTLAQFANGSVISKKARLGISLLSALVFLGLVFLLCWLVKRKSKGRQRKYMLFMEDRTDLNDQSKINSELQFFDRTTVAAATDNFSVANKLGKGGFGSVYKGVLHNGKEVAVKRLSKNSGQGVEEFKNEVVIIAKLQHRNLVKIIGCCVEDKEKMVIYEYVLNKSLDFFIFDETKRNLLDWTKRFEIICGIARGILYLHQDSRLRIIHRDLKASNILLDASMSPKIADFGMARIFLGDQCEANTHRVVGTYGYMSPEYAMEGIFSVKSDVYSFGVLLLEIITGRRNSGYHHKNYPHSNLVGYVWDLWREGNALEIVDPSMAESYHVNDVVRCIQIALLCVQEFAVDRPTMSAVVFMLGNEAAVPSPTQPAFLLTRSRTGVGPSTSTEGANSINDVTCTEIEAR